MRERDPAAQAQRAARYLPRIRAIVLDGLARHPGVTVYLFGSYAGGPARRLSDVDVAIDAPGDLPRAVIAELRETLEESTVPLRVDLVDLRDADPAFGQRVRREGIRWTASKNA